MWQHASRYEKDNQRDAQNDMTFIRAFMKQQRTNRPLTCYNKMCTNNQ